MDGIFKIVCILDGGLILVNLDTVGKGPNFTDQRWPITDQNTFSETNIPVIYDACNIEMDL